VEKEIKSDEVLKVVSKSLQEQLEDFPSRKLVLFCAVSNVLRHGFAVSRVDMWGDCMIRGLDENGEPLVLFPKDYPWEAISRELVLFVPFNLKDYIETTTKGLQGQAQEDKSLMKRPGQYI
jgi:hypothetical protein